MSKSRDIKKSDKKNMKKKKDQTKLNPNDPKYMKTTPPIKSPKFITG